MFTKNPVGSKIPSRSHNDDLDHIHRSRTVDPLVRLAPATTGTAAEPHLHKTAYRDQRGGWSLAY